MPKLGDPLERLVELCCRPREECPVNAPGPGRDSALLVPSNRPFSCATSTLLGGPNVDDGLSAPVSPLTSYAPGPGERALRAASAARAPRAPPPVADVGEAWEAWEAWEGWAIGENLEPGAEKAEGEDAPPPTAPPPRALPAFRDAFPNPKRGAVARVDSHCDPTAWRFG